MTPTHGLLTPAPLELLFEGERILKVVANLRHNLANHIFEDVCARTRDNTTLVSDATDTCKLL